MRPLLEHREPVRLQALLLDQGGMLFDAALWNHAAAPPALDDLLPAPDALPVTSGGRQAAWYVHGAYGDAVLRHYRRGGWMARINRQLYGWQGAVRTRAFAELRLLDKLHALGLAVPRPLAAGYWRRAGVFYTAAILTQRIAGVRTLAQALGQTSSDSMGRSEKPEWKACAAVGYSDLPMDAINPGKIAAAIAAMHDAGVWHADLNAHNVLLDAQGTVWLIDFDRGRDHGAPLTQTLRAANLQRLRRSLEKVAGEVGLALWRDLNRAYVDLSRASPRNRVNSF